MTPSPKKKAPLKVGQRVRVYEGSRTWTGTVEPIVDSPSFPGGVLVRRDKRVDGLCHAALVHEKQVRRLSPKRPEKPERVEFRHEAFGCAWPKGTSLHFAKSTAEKEAAAYGGRWFRYVELRSGEVPVSREALAKAWDSVLVEENAPMLPAGSRVSLTFEEFCKALGLEKP